MRLRKVDRRVESMQRIVYVSFPQREMGNLDLVYIGFELECKLNLDGNAYLFRHGTVA